MDPAQTQNNADVLAAITAMKTDIQSTIDARLEAQKTEFEERFKTVDNINDTLEKARQAQVAAQQQQQPGWVPKSWDEIPKLVQTEASRIAEETLKAREQKENEERQRKANDEAAMEAELDKSLQALEKNGYLPPVGNPNDESDPGVSARRELMGAAVEMGTKELDKVANALTQLHRNNMVFDPRTKSYISADNSLAPLPGKFAPVGNSSVNAPSQFSGPTTRDLRNMSMDDLVSLAEQRGYGPAPTNVAEQPGF